MTKIGFVGIGKMATAIIAGLDKEKYDVQISSRDKAETTEKAAELSVTAAASHQELINDSDIIILSVKPQVLPGVLADLDIPTGKTLVSIAAGLTLDKLAELAHTDKQAIIRIMPNINATIGQSTSAIVGNAYVSGETYDFVKGIFANVGSVHDIAEKDFSTFAAIAGSSPAYIYMFIDAMSRAAVLQGLPKDTATKIVAETVAASANMLLSSGENPWSLVDKVSSPGGTTVAGVVSLEHDGFVTAVIDAITATVEKDKALGK